MLKITIESDDETRVVDFLAEEQKAFEHVENMPIDWIELAIKSKTRIAISNIVKENSDKQPNKIPETERLTIVKNADIMSAKERKGEVKK